MQLFNTPTSKIILGESYMTRIGKLGSPLVRCLVISCITFNKYLVRSNLDGSLHIVTSGQISRVR